MGQVFYTQISWVFPPNLVLGGRKIIFDNCFKNGILLAKFFWPSVRKNCSSDRENSGGPNWRIIWSTKIKPKLNKIEKNLQKTGFLWQFLFNFDGFSQFLQFWLNLSAPTHQSGLQFGRPDFLIPLAPLEARK